MGLVASVNVGRQCKVGTKMTGIDKRPVDRPVEIRAPGGPRGAGSGLVGDEIVSGRYHGGDDQAVYAYAREDLDWWSAQLHRRLGDGTFGENLTTVDIDVNGARIGERWQVGGELLLEVTRPRVPCGVFQTWMGERAWIKRFNVAVLPGAYLRVVHPGRAAAGAPIEIVHRPDHEVTVGLVFRALTREPELLPAILAADSLPDQLKRKAQEAAAI